MRKNKDHRVKLYESKKKGEKYYRIGYTINGKRIMEGCGTSKLKAKERQAEKEAELESQSTYSLSQEEILFAKYAKDISVKEGVPINTMMKRIGFGLPEEAIVFSKNMMGFCKEIDITFDKITKFLLNNKEKLTEVLTPCTLETSISDFYLSRINKRCRPATIKFYKDYLGPFLSHFGKDTQITEVEPLFESYFMGIKARLHAKRAFLCFLEFCKNQKYINSNWMARIKFDKILKDKKAPVIVSPLQARIILEKIGCDNMKLCYALMMFCGIRPYEVIYTKVADKKVLAWEDINFELKTINIRPETAKCRDPRLLQNMPETIWTWLSTVPEEKRKGQVFEGEIQRHRRAIAKMKELGIPYIPDIMRHSFASYGYYMMGKEHTVDMMGHTSKSEDAIFKKHYKGLSNKSMAEEFFAILPQKQSSSTNDNKSKTMNPEPSFDLISVNM